MNVKKLKELLENVDDNALVVVPGSDHSYTEGIVYEDTAGISEDLTHLSEWHGEENAKEFGESPIPVLVIE